MKKAIFPGSFDPFHSGHEFVVNQALNDFDFLYIVISWNEDKQRHESFETAKRKLEKKYKDNQRIKILVNKNQLTTEIANNLNCFNIVRGIRNEQDIEYENNLRLIYQQQLPKINITYYKSDIKISSTLLKKMV